MSARDMTRGARVLALCLEPRTIEEIQAKLGGDAKANRWTVYNLVARGKLVNLTTGTKRTALDQGLFVLPGWSPSRPVAEADLPKALRAHLKTESAEWQWSAGADLAAAWGIRSP